LKIFLPIFKAAAISLLPIPTSTTVPRSITIFFLLLQKKRYAVSLFSHNTKHFACMGRGYSFVTFLPHSGQIAYSFFSILSHVLIFYLRSSNFSTIWAYHARYALTSASYVADAISLIADLRCSQSAYPDALAYADLKLFIKLITLKANNRTMPVGVVVVCVRRFYAMKKFFSQAFLRCRSCFVRMSAIFIGTIPAATFY
jgi:hypothetical protein